MKRVRPLERGTCDGCGSNGGKHWEGCLCDRCKARVNTLIAGMKPREEGEIMELICNREGCEEGATHSGVIEKERPYTMVPLCRKHAAMNAKERTKDQNDWAHGR